MQRVRRRRLETEVCVKVSGIVVQRMHQHRSDTDQISRGDTAADGITQQMGTQTRALFGTIDRQPG